MICLPIVVRNVDRLLPSKTGSIWKRSSLKSCRVPPRQPARDRAGDDAPGRRHQLVGPPCPHGACRVACPRARARGSGRSRAADPTRTSRSRAARFRPAKRQLVRLDLGARPQIDERRDPRRARERDRSVFDLVAHVARRRRAHPRREGSVRAAPGSESVPRAVKSTVPERRATLLRTSREAAETIRTSSDVRSFQGSRAARAAPGRLRDSRSETVTSTSFVYVPRCSVISPRISRSSRFPEATRSASTTRRSDGIARTETRRPCRRHAKARELVPVEPEGSGDERLAVGDLGAESLDLSGAADQPQRPFDFVERIPECPVAPVRDPNRAVEVGLLESSRSRRRRR